MIRLYFKEKKNRIFLDWVFVGVFALCFALTDVSLSRIWYPAVICLVFFLLFVAWDFYHFRIKHLFLLQICNHIDETAEYLPGACGQLEEDYQQLVRIVLETYKKRLITNQQKLVGSKEYITLWAHQIKTPLTALGLITQELGEANALEKKKEIANRLFEVEQYVDTSLQYMRLDTMISDLVLQEYPVFNIVKQAVKYFARTFISKGISLQMQEEDVTVVTDEKWLLFVMKQILSNALKYTKAGSVSIYMHPTKNQVLVIEDTGIGIAAEDLPRIYDRGFTGCNGRIQEKSTGIGLYLSKQVLERLGHEILVSSEEGNGTKVEVVLERDDMG